MTTDNIWVRILNINDCGTENFLNVFTPCSCASMFWAELNWSGVKLSLKLDLYDKTTYK